MFDQLVKFMMALVIVGVVSFIGAGLVGHTAQMTDGTVNVPAPVAPPATVAMVATPPIADVTQTIDDAFGWIPIIIVAMCAVMVLGLLFSVFGSDFGTPIRTPEPTREPTPTRLFWEPDTQTVRSVPAKRLPVTPAPILPTVPTVDDLVARDPEIQAMNRDIQDIDAEIAVLRDERRQHLTDRSRVDRLLLWLKRRSRNQRST